MILSWWNQPIKQHLRTCFILKGYWLKAWYSLLHTSKSAEPWISSKVLIEIEFSWKEDQDVANTIVNIHSIARDVRVGWLWNKSQMLRGNSLWWLAATVAWTDYFRPEKSLILCWWGLLWVSPVCRPYCGCPALNTPANAVERNGIAAGKFRKVIFSCSVWTIKEIRPRI